ncbi:hypothetical protein MMC09_004404 [Bachmanniomyces sp. S44760]|nr:hypothetical protein [Bachmanniomyces sp. S44760]
MLRRGGRRGHPLLAGAVVVGASRSAARHEVSAQSQRDAEAQRSAERNQREDNQRRALANEQSRFEEQERERRTKLAIDEAIAIERSRSRGPLPMGMDGQQGGYQMPPNGVSYQVDHRLPPPAYPYGNGSSGAMEPMREMKERICTACGRTCA